MQEMMFLTSPAGTNTLDRGASAKYAGSMSYSADSFARATNQGAEMLNSIGRS